MKWRNYCNGDLMKCRNITVLFSYLQVPPPPPPSMTLLTGPEGGFTHQFMIHVCLYHPRQLSFHITLPFPHHLHPPSTNFPLSIPLRITCNLFPPRSPISLSLTIPLLHHLFYPILHLSLPLLLTHHITIHILYHLSPPFEHLSLSITLPLPKTPYLYQVLPRCCLYVNTSQIIQCI